MRTARLLPCLPAALLLLVTLVPPAATRAGSIDFPHGVAARATAHSARLWSRATEEGIFHYQVATDRKFSDIVAAGSARSKSERNFTLRARADKLEAATRYYYRFFAEDGSLSDRGKFTTLPRKTEAAAMKLAFTGDSDIEWTDHPDPDETSPFEVLRRVKEEQADLFVYLGDTMYSDSETGSDPALSRSEKWAKYRDNRTGRARKLLRSVSTWAMWDDHEVINDFDGEALAAEDPALLKAGVKAFSDYWPVPNHWPLDEGRTYKKVNFGKKIDLFFLDERMYREQSADETDSPCRDSEGELDLAPTLSPEQRAQLGLGPVDPACLAHFNEPRSMLGGEQKKWFKRALRNSTARWKIVMNEVPIVQLFVLPYDRWEGYGSERDGLLNFIRRENINGVVFLTTDIHAHIGSPTFIDIREPDAQPVAYEVVTGPIQTCTLDCEIDRILGSSAGGEVLQQFLLDNDLVYENPSTGLPDCVNQDDYGYSTITADRGAKTLRVAWKSNRPGGGGGGEAVDDCSPRSLKPTDP